MPSSSEFSLSSRQADAWHALVATAPLPAVLEALRAGLVPVPCVASDGSDLLNTLLCRPVEDAGGGLNRWWGQELKSRPEGSGRNSPWVPYPRLAEIHDTAHPNNFREAHRTFSQTALALLARPDVDPFKVRRVRPQVEAPADASSLDMALACNLPAVVEAILRHPERPVDWAARATQPSLEGVGAVEAGLPWLHAAVAGDRSAMVDVLLDAGVDAHVTDRAGRTALYHATSLEMLQRLLGAGIDPMRSAGKLSLIEHYGVMQKRSSYAKGLWQDMAAVIMAQSPEAVEKNAAAQAVLWFGEARTEVRANMGRQGLENMANEFRAGWEQHMLPALARKPLAELTRNSVSGPLQGRMSLVAELGWRLLDGAPSAAHLWLMDPDDVDTLFHAPAREVRRGVWDMGLFALGAQHTLMVALDRAKVGDRSYVSNTHPEVREATAANLAAVQRVLDTAQNGDWDKWIIETSATLQRPKSLAMWDRVERAWGELFARRETTGQANLPAHLFAEGQRALSATQRERAQRSNQDLAYAAAIGGVRFHRKAHLQRLCRWSRTMLPGAPRATAVTAQKWLVMALCALADTAVFLELSSSNANNVSEIKEKKALAQAVVVALETFVNHEIGWPDVPEAIREKMDQGLMAGSESEPALESRSRSIRLDQTLEKGCEAKSFRRVRM